MSSKQSEFPYYLAVVPRPLRDTERACVDRLLEGAAPEYLEQVDDLRVVGRCGCGRCPSVFFVAAENAHHEAALVSLTGRDKLGGLVGAALLVSGGRLTQLAFHSVDGHEPWLVPEVETLKPDA